MNRAWVLAAAALAVTGCIESDRSEDIGFFWRFQDAKGHVTGNFTAANPGCGVAAVTTIRIEIDGTTNDVDCLDSNGVPGVTLTRFFPGTYPFTILGFRNTEEVFAEAGNVTVHAGHLAEVDATLVAEGTSSTLPVYYQQNGSWSCYQTPGVAFRLEDLSGNLVDEVNSTSPIACDTTVFGFTVSTSLAGSVLPFGSYRFRYLALLNSAGEALYEVCGTGWSNGITPLPPNAAATFDHEGFSQTINLPPLPGSGYYCL
jgi:hypothetical protein